MVDSPSYQVPHLYCYYNDNKFSITKRPAHTGPSELQSLLYGEIVPTPDGKDVLKITGSCHLRSNEVITIDLDKENLESLMRDFVSSYLKHDFVARVEQGFRWCREEFQGDCYEELLSNLLPFILGKMLLEAIPECEEIRHVLRGSITRTMFMQINEILELGELPDLIDDPTLHDLIWHHLHLLSHFGTKYGCFFYPLQTSKYDRTYLTRKCFAVLQQKVRWLSSRVHQLEHMNSVQP